MPDINRKFRNTILKDESRQILIIGQKIPLSTFEAGYIYYADSFPILIQGVKDECIFHMFR